jgi:hypothetical protein
MMFSVAMNGFYGLKRIKGNKPLTPPAIEKLKFSALTLVTNLERVRRAHLSQFKGR